MCELYCGSAGAPRHPEDDLYRMTKVGFVDIKD